MNSKVRHHLEPVVANRAWFEPKPEHVHVLQEPKLSQKERILAYLKTGKGLTVIAALREFGCFALSQRIGELRRAGHPITRATVKTISGKRVGYYLLDVGKLGE
jgi:hypothetical protein